MVINCMMYLSLVIGIKSYDAYQKFPSIVNRLRAVNVRLSASTSAAVALIFKGNCMKSKKIGQILF